MTDTPGHGRPQQDDDSLRHTLTIQDVSARLIAAGVPRSERQIKRYCETAFLDAKKIPGPTGEQWFVTPAALPKLIGDLQQWQAQRAGHSRVRPAVSDHVPPVDQGQQNNDTAGHGRLDQDMTAGKDPKNGGAGELVIRLEREVERLTDDRDFLRDQINVKDGTIASLLERDRETNVLIRGLQEMLTPLLASPRRDDPPVNENDPTS